MVKLTDLERTLCELIELPSINPSLKCDDQTLTGEEKIAAYLESRAAQVGISSKRMKVLSGRDNLLLSIRPRGKVKSRIILAPHMDVVPAPKTSFKPKRKKGRIYGRGACDTKGSMTAFFHAFLKIAQNGAIPQNTEILFIGLVDEEFSQAGSRKLSQKGPRANLAIAGEPTSLKVVSAHKGNLWIRLKTTGKAAHGSTPQYGVNAIEKMTPVVRLISRAYQDFLKRKTHPLLGHPTVNIGKIQGGIQPNVVPETCEIDIDRRTLPGETDLMVEAEIKKLLRHHKVNIPEFSVSRSVPCPPLDTNQNLPAVQAFLKAANRRKTVGVPYFTDAAPIAMGGTPALVYGPGNIAQAHALDEWVAIKELEKAEACVFRFLNSLP